MNRHDVTQFLKKRPRCGGCLILFSFTVLVIGIMLFAATYMGLRSKLHGTIAFSRSVENRHEIYAMQANGRKIRRVVSSPLDSNSSPALSPDGTRLAFVSNRHGNADIYTMDLDDGNITRLTTHPAPDRNPAWSRDGMHLAFNSYRDGNEDIYIMELDGRHLTRVTSHPAHDQHPDWSPDGTSLLFASNRGGTLSDIYRINIDGTQVTRLTDRPDYDGAPVWSPDGTRIAFASNPNLHFVNIYTMNADGSEVQRVTKTGYQPSFASEGPEWSPDGEFIAFAGISSHPMVCHIYVIRADGSEQVQLTEGWDLSWGP